MGQPKHHPHPFLATLTSGRGSCVCIASVCAFLVLAPCALAQLQGQALPPSEAPAPPGEPLQWLVNPQQAMQRAAEINRPILVYFYSNQAIACRDMEQLTFNEPQVAAAMRGFVLVAINIADNPQLGRNFGLYRVPSVYFLTKDGQPVDRAIGVKPPALFITYLNRAATEDGTKPLAPRSIAAQLRQPGQNTFPCSFVFQREGLSAVYVAGDFNDWRFDELPLTASTTEKNRWELKIYLPEGAHQYKFYLPDTREYLSDPLNPYWRGDPFGGKNSILVVGNPLMGPKIEGSKVTFYLYDKDAKKAEIASSFSGWQTLPLYSNGKGTWGVIFNLPPGKHEYKYVVDGTWILDPANLKTSTSDVNTENSVIEVQ